MVNVVATSKEIQAGVEDIVQRTNTQIEQLNMLPPTLRSQMDLQVYDDIEYLLKYIAALHGVLEDVSKPGRKDTAFEF